MQRGRRAQLYRASFFIFMLVNRTADASRGQESEGRLTTTEPAASKSGTSIFARFECGVGCFLAQILLVFAGDAKVVARTAGCEVQLHLALIQPQVLGRLTTHRHVMRA
jgi:hypothetical protein